MGKKSKEKEERKLGVQEVAGSRRSKLEQIYLWVIEGGTYLILLTPLVLFKDYFFPFVVPKSIFFRIMVDIIFLAYLLLVVSNRRFRPRLNMMTVVIAFFLGVAFLTSVTGINFTRSFWSTFERMAGLLTFLHLFVFFIVLTNVFKEKKYWDRILTVSILVGVFLCSYVWISTDPIARGGGTLGNTSFLSAYLIFNVFLAAIMFFSKPGFWKLLYGPALVVLTWILLFPPKEPTQGAIGAFWGGVFVIALGYLVFYLISSQRKALKRLVPAVFILLILAGFGFSQTGFFKNNLQEILESNSWQARALVWQIGYEAWQERPWLGWGQENFNVPFANNFNPILPLTADVWYDRVHNIFIDTAVTSGILGLVSYLAIFAAAIFGLIKVALRVSERRNVFLPLGMIAILLVYLAQNIWVFDMISSYMMLFLSLAFISFLVSQPKPEVQEPAGLKLSPVGSLLPGLLILVTLATIYFGNIQPARASYNLVKGVSGPLETGIPAFKKAIELSPIALTEASEQFSRRVGELTFNENAPQDLLKQGFEGAAQEMEKSLKENSQDFRAYLVIGRHYTNFYYFIGNQEYLDLADQYLTQSIELSPQNQQAYWSLAEVKIAKGEEEAISLMKKAVELEPRYYLARWYLVMTYKAFGRHDLAAETIKEAEEDGANWKTDLSKIKEMINIYQELQDDQKLVSLYAVGIELEPNDARLYGGLAVAYANLGQFDKARELALEAIRLNPEFKDELETFLASLPE